MSTNRKYIIRSNDRKDKATSSNSFVLSWVDALQGTFVVEYTIPPTGLFNVHTSNNTIVYQHLGFDYMTSIEPGQYTGQQLATVLNSSLVADFIWTFDTITEKFSIGAAVTIMTSDSKNTINELLGFDPNVQAGAVLAPYVLPLRAQLNVPPMLGVRISDSSSTGGITSKRVNVDLLMPIFPGYVSHTDLKQTIRFRSGVKNIKVEVIDMATGNLFPTQNRDWEIYLKLLSPPMEKSRKRPADFQL